METTQETQTTKSHPLHQLDRLLRGDATRSEHLKTGFAVSPSGLIVVILALGFFYGACMGCYALFQQGGSSVAQFLSTMGKVPLLFLLTFFVTFPSLYVFNALVGSRLTLQAVARLVVAALAVMLAILASLGPIVAFFSLSTTSYSWMLLLNVMVFAVSGFLGLRFLLVTLHRLTEAQREDIEVPSQDDLLNIDNGALDRPNNATRDASVSRVFTIWLCVFGLVGAQMAWVMRPFLGLPGGEFVLLRLRESNFFQGLWNTILAAMS
ncbi:MAG TPA: hypothetical protein VF681_05605 [Abditibacteriaceae bacterium]|jgi:hypothetical protein